MHVDETGKPVEPVRPLDESIETLERFRDLLMVKLAKANVTQRGIAVVVGLDQANVCRRLKGIPSHVREFYEKQTLDGLG